ncbi:MAG: endonuclease III [Deltaproteobacteria bacterium]|jgi:endonuclease-3|nr:endonuclease III [Deltaproteobacteria bacterium]
MSTRGPKPKVFLTYSTGFYNTDRNLVNGPPPDHFVFKVIEFFDQKYPGAKCGLDYKTHFQLLVATILSAQCTDKRVNLVTPGFFSLFPTPEKLAVASLKEVEEAIKSCGLFRSKAKNLKKTAQMLVSKYSGRVPGDVTLLRTFPGVGRKTANVIMGDAFGVPSLTIDTHMARITQRLGLTSKPNVVAIEKDLMFLVPQFRWTLFSHQMIAHGRALCLARHPYCHVCALIECPSRTQDYQESEPVPDLEFNFDSNSDPDTNIVT